MKIEQLLDGIQKHFQEAGHNHNKWPIRAVVALPRILWNHGRALQCAA